MSYRSDAWGEDFEIDYGKETDSIIEEQIIFKNLKTYILFLSQHKMLKN